MPKLTVKCSDSEMEGWKEEAWTAKVTLSEWVRERLNGGALAAGEPDRATLGESPVADSPPSPAPAASATKCSRGARHHINHAGKPCPECGWPT